MSRVNFGRGIQLHVLLGSGRFGDAGLGSPSAIHHGQKYGRIGQIETHTFFWPSWPFTLEVFSGALLKPLVVDSKVKALGDLVGWQQVRNRIEGRKCSRGFWKGQPLGLSVITKRWCAIVFKGKLEGGEGMASRAKAADNSTSRCDGRSTRRHAWSCDAAWVE